MADSAALLVDEILPHQPMRQWVLSAPFPLRLLFASNSKAMTGVLRIVYRTIATHLTHKAGFTKPMARTGAVTLIQPIASRIARNLEHLCRYITRPAVSTKRLSMTRNGQVRSKVGVLGERPGVTAPHTSYSSHWISYPGWLRWYPNPEST